MFELYNSLVHADEDFVYDMYTAFKHKVDKVQRYAVGITRGFVAVDGKDPKAKAEREYFFPMKLLNEGIGFR